MKRRVDGAGCDGIHADAVFGVLHREMLGDRLKTPFGDHRHRRRDAPDRVASQGRCLATQLTDNDNDAPMR